MADTIRSDYPDKFCVWCGSKGCHLQHWGPLFRGKVVYLDNCAVELRSVNGKGVEPKFDCDTGEPLTESTAATAKDDSYGVNVGGVSGD